MTPMRYRSTDVNGRKVFYRESGPPGAPKLLLLHGYPSASHMFRELIPQLADRFHLVAPDLLGFGQSDMPSRDTSDPLADLAAELADFQRGVSRPGRLSLVGTMLQDSTAPEARMRYQAQVIAPRRQRIRAILERAQRLGLIDAGADLEVAVTMGTGSWYARALAGEGPPPGWPARAAALVWRAAGGTIAPGPRPPGWRPHP